jgi:5'-deoxynucleotidase YfbR-like HD superfamily hydrolase
MDLLNLFSVVRGLASVRRFSMESLHSPESVLEHTGMVALTVFTICWKLALCPRDTHDALQFALVHDLEEVFVGDVARPTKHHSNETRYMFKELSSIGIDNVETILEVHGLTYIHEQAKEGRIGTIVALADMLAVVYKVWDEVLVHGNLSMVRQAETVGKQIALIKEKVKNHWGHEPESYGLLMHLVDEAVHLANQASKMRHDLLRTIQERKDEDYDTSSGQLGLFG